MAGGGLPPASARSVRISWAGAAADLWRARAGS